MPLEERFPLGRIASWLFVSFPPVVSLVVVANLEDSMTGQKSNRLAHLLDKPYEFGDSPLELNEAWQVSVTGHDGPPLSRPEGARR